ncbi:MAG: helix-turn-helix transcriptional regulator [Hyphomicrobiales bacterium]
MSVYDIFAANLRATCGRYKSIAEVCRGSGINRQQFNRYLAGQNLPNKRTLSRLCAFLRIEEVSLFSSSKTATDASPFAGQSEKYVAQLREGGRTQTVLGPGFYACYFPLQGHDGFIVKSIVRVWLEGDACHFIRHTIFRSAGSPDVRLAQGRHVGTVLANDRDIYLIGVNKLKPHHISTIVVERQHVDGGQVLHGLAITKGMAHDFACRVCLEFLGTKQRDARGSYPSLGMMPVSDARVNPVVSLIMASGNDSRPSQLAAANFENALFKLEQ